MKFFLISFLLFFTTINIAHAAISLTVNLSENVVVTGTPRLQLNIGGVTRFAPYVSGSGTSVLTFSYDVVVPDFDRDGLALVSPLDLNGGTIRDLSGNNANLTFVPPNTSGVLVQSYTSAWTTSPIDATNETSAAFNIIGAPITGATYNYTITSSGGGGSVTGSGTISANPHPVTGINVSTLPAGTLTVSVTVTNATGTGNAKTATVTTSPFVGILDSLPASAAAYSVRRLRSAYTASLIRVRRSSDNTEQDIGFTIGGNLNTTALTTFCGANSCFIRTWYDQSGNARNATQTTNANQPRIVNAGTLEVFNTRPTLNWIRTNSNYMLTGYVFSMSQVSVNYAFKANSLNAAQLFDIRDVGGSPLIDCAGTDGFAGRRRNDSNSIISTTTHTNRNTIPHVTTKTYDGTNIISYLDGGDSRVVASGGATTGPFRIGIGTNGLSLGLNIFDGNISEFTYFNSSLSTTDRQTLEGNQKTYFGTP